MARHTIPDTIERSAAPTGRLASAGRQPRDVAAAVPVDEESHHLRRAAVRPAPARWPRPALRVGRVRDLLRALRRRLPDQRHRRPRGGPAASGQEASADRVGRVAGERRAHARRCCWRCRRSTARILSRPLFGVLASAYLGLLALYSGPLKHIVIIDVLTIAIGFVLRAAGGRRGDRRGDQPLALRPDDSAGAVSGAQQTPARAGAAWRRARPDTGGSWRNTARTCSTR